MTKRLKSLSRGYCYASSDLRRRVCARAGPPFISDDPETPGNGNWEINECFIGDRNPQSGAYQTPDLDTNYGLGDRIQLKYELPLAVAETRPQPAQGTGGTVLAGLGESLLGFKFRFYEHKEAV
jgi:hypothetical protein